MMLSLTPWPVALGTLLLTLGAARADTVDARCDIYPKGSDKASAVVPCTFSQRQGYVRIERADGTSHDLSPVGSSAGRYVDQDGRPAYRQSGLGRQGQIYRLAKESVYVYWDTAGLPGPVAAPAASAPLATLPPPAPTAVPFEQALTLFGVGFRVTSSNDGSLNDLTIVPSGLSAAKAPVVRRIDGQVVGAEVADLDADGSPELYVYVRSAGSGSYGSLIAFRADRRQGLQELHLPPVTAAPAAARGYMGHDEFAVVERSLVRRFPVYRDTDTNAAPSGGVRQMQYRLVPGTPGRQLQLERVTDF